MNINDRMKVERGFRRIARSIIWMGLCIFMAIVLTCFF